MTEAGPDRRLARLVAFAPTALPAAAFVVTRLVAGGGREAVFQAGLAALVLGVVLGARPRAQPLLALPELAGAAVLTGAAQAVLGGGWAGALALAWLLLATGIASWGLARLGRLVGAPAFPAFAVACLVLFTAMLGLVWADPSARWVERTRRRAYRQAVLHVDPALALAYGAAGYDRLRDPDVYFRVPLASSAYHVPRADSTGLAWLLVGALGSTAAGLFEVRRGRDR